MLEETAMPRGSPTAAGTAQPSGPPRVPVRRCARRYRGTRARCSSARTPGTEVPPPCAASSSCARSDRRCPRRWRRCPRGAARPPRRRTSAPEPPAGTGCEPRHPPKRGRTRAPTRRRPGAVANPPPSRSAAAPGARSARPAVGHSMFPGRAASGMPLRRRRRQQSCAAVCRQAWRRNQCP